MTDPGHAVRGEAHRPEAGQDPTADEAGPHFSPRLMVRGLMSSTRGL